MKKLLVLALGCFLALFRVAYADSLGSATGGQAANQSSLSGCKYNASAPSLSDGQQVGQQCDASGNEKTIATITPGLRTLVTLDVKTVTTGGVAVSAISAGHRSAGGFLQNPIGAVVALCINEIGTASGTTSSGDTTCIQPGQSYNVAPASTAVSVISSDSSHPFSGYGLQ